MALSSYARLHLITRQYVVPGCNKQYQLVTSYYHHQPMPSSRQEVAQEVNGYGDIALAYQ
jgi:hypothetical protein